MFASTKTLPDNVSPETVKRLSAILTDYHDFAMHNPDVLRLLIPSEEVWRFFIDGIHQSVNCFEQYEYRERGYLTALYNSYHDIFDRNTTLNVDFIKRLHRLATTGVTATAYQYKQNEMGQFRRPDQMLEVNLLSKNCSLDGIYEFSQNTNPSICLAIRIRLPHCLEMIICLNERCLNNIQNDTQLFDQMLEMISQDVINIEYSAMVPKEMQNSLVKLLTTLSKSVDKINFAKKLMDFILEYENTNHFGVYYQMGISFRHTLIKNDNTKPEDDIIKLVNNYNTELLKASNPIEKIKIIISFIHSCEQLHPFIDCNCRVFCMLLLNHLLINNGFPLAMLADPNRFDFYSRDELLLEVLAGMENTFKLIRTNELNGVKTSDIKKDTSCRACYFEAFVKIEETARKRSAKRQCRNSDA